MTATGSVLSVTVERQSMMMTWLIVDVDETVSEFAVTYDSG